MARKPKKKDEDIEAYRHEAEKRKNAVLVGLASYDTSKPKPKKYSRDGRAPIPKKETTSRIMSAIKDKDTKPELLLRKALWREEIRGYRLHWEKAPGRPDIAFPGKKIAIFVHGCFWHRCPYCQPPMPRSHSKFWKDKFIKNVTRDKKKIELLQEQGWKTFVIWECHIKANLSDYLKIIKKSLSVN